MYQNGEVLFGIFFFSWWYPFSFWQYVQCLGLSKISIWCPSQRFPFFKRISQSVLIYLMTIYYYFMGMMPYPNRIDISGSMTGNLLIHSRNVGSFGPNLNFTLWQLSISPTGPIKGVLLGPIKSNLIYWIFYLSGKGKYIIFQSSCRMQYSLCRGKSFIFKILIFSEFLKKKLIVFDAAMLHTLHLTCVKVSCVYLMGGIPELV